MRSKTTREIYAYWNALRGQRDVPARSQIEPARIRHILPDLFILERTQRGDIRFRLAGTRICGLFARELRGSRFDALWLGSQTATLETIASDVMARNTPVLLTADAAAGAADPLSAELVLLPLRSPDGSVDRVIGSLTTLSQPYWLESTPINFLTLRDVRGVDGENTPSFPQSAPEISPASKTYPITDAIRRVLHLRVLDGGRRD